MNYWYENVGLLKSEEDGYIKFKDKNELKNSNHSMNAVADTQKAKKKEIEIKNIQIRKDFDKQKRLVYFVQFNYRASKAELKDMIGKSKFSDQLKQKAYDTIESYKELPERFMKVMIRYDHDFPGYDATGLFGGAIKVFLMSKHDARFHHLIPDKASGLKYLCQEFSRTRAEVNSEKTLASLLRCCNVYELWMLTGLDVDR